MEAESSLLQSTIDQLKETSETLQKEHDLQTQRLQAELTSLNEEQTAVLESKNTVEKEMIQLEETNSRLKLNIGSLEEEKLRLNSQIALDKQTYDAESVVLSKQIEEMQQAIEESKILRNSVVSQLQEKQIEAAKAQELSGDIQQLKQQQSDMETQINELQSRLLSELEKLRSQHQGVLDEVAKCDTQILELQVTKP